MTWLAGVDLMKELCREKTKDNGLWRDMMSRGMIGNRCHDWYMR